MAVAVPALTRFRTVWSSSRFSRRSTAHTCQPGARATIARASGAKYAALAEVPGLRTRTLRAEARPTFRMPTLSYLTGPAGARTPAMRSNRAGLVASAGEAVVSRATEAAPAARAAARRSAWDMAAG